MRLTLGEDYECACLYDVVVSLCVCITETRIFAFGIFETFSVLKCTQGKYLFPAVLRFMHLNERSQVDSQVSDSICSLR